MLYTIFVQKMLAIYGRARVGTAVFDLAQSVGITAKLFDDIDTEFDPSLYTGVIPSPGVKPNNRAFSRGNTVSELDFANAFLPDGFTIIAITGTDGKSTTAWMLYQLLCAEFGKSQVWLSGNFEIPFSETVRLIRESGASSGYIVVEVSSFMANGLGNNLHILEYLQPPLTNTGIQSTTEGINIRGFRPNITIFTNFERDHLDWHDGIEEYFEAKIRLVERTQTRAYIGSSIYFWAKKLQNSFAQNCLMNLQKGESPGYIELYEFGTTPKLSHFTDGSHIFVKGELICQLEKSIFRGKHNALNLLSVVSVAIDLSISPKNIVKHLPKFSNLPHRLELVGEYQGITFVDDSKSTSAQSLRAGLSAYATKNVILIAGGHDKGDVFTELITDFTASVKYTVCIGATAHAFITVSQSAKVPWGKAVSMQGAVDLALETAKKGDIILLSPGCASFGMFRNYLDRAEQFRAAFAKLIKK